MARILVVDDEPDVTVMLKFMLEKDGHAVSMANDGLQALAALGLEPADPAKPLPDLVLLDMMMPGMDGYEVCARMYDDPRTRAVPILMLTGKDDMRDLNHRTPNIAAHIGKPFDPRGLRELIAGMMGKRD
ncbi:MAG: response regulator [Elusimicrobia bacterium]|nr:response regulator [Elusimicrobiota bacterium]